MEYETVETESSVVCGVRLDGERSISADAVLLAMGPWSPNWLGLPRAIGTKYHSLLMRPERTLSQAVFFQGIGDPEACVSAPRSTLPRPYRRALAACCME